MPVALGASGSWMWAACYALNGPCVPVVIANATAGATIAYVFGRAIDLADEFPAGLSPVVLVLALLYGAAAFLGSAPGLFVVAGIAGVTTTVHWVVVRRRSAVLSLPEGAAPLFEGGGQSTPRTLEQLAAALRSPMYQPPAEFEVLRAAFLPRDVEGSLWVGLVGPTAAGKTAAARHLIRELHSTHKDLKVLSGRCSEDSAPYQAFREALADVGVPSAFIAARMQGGGMTGMFDRLADEIIPFWDFFSGYRDDEDEEDDEANRGELFAAVTNALHTLAQKHRVVLFLDDVQWIDEGSAALLKHLKENFTPPADSPPIILLGGRDAATMERLGMEEAIHRISPPSSADQVRILEGSLGIERGSARRLVQAMGVLGDQAGGMFWLIRAVQELISNDGLVTTSRGFTLKKQYLKRGQLPVPAAMRTSLAEALRASAEYRPVLECAALLGEEFRVEDVADCLKMDRLELLQILRHLDQELHLVRDLPHDQECYAFSSAFVLDIVREDLGIGGSSNRPPSKIARELHARIGQVLECRTPRTAELVFRIARHFSRAGASWSERAVEHCRAAARIARLKRDFKEARRFLSMAENSSRRARRPLNLRHERLLVDAAEAHASGRNVVQAAEAILLSIRQEEHSDRDLLSTSAILCRDAAKETGDVRWSEQLRVLERRIHAQSQKT
ncbi:MAG: AAA family ATPase [Planctomycetaceae bacterium]|nr:AAA family ATPase [Planctomycetaceae bacterium]